MLPRISSTGIGVAMSYPSSGRIGVIVGPGCVKRCVSSTLTARPMPSRIRQLARRERPSWATSSGAAEQTRQSKWASAARTRRINVTDPDSRTLKDGRRFIQGYNAQAAVTEDQIVVAAEVTTAARDSVVFETMVAAAQENLADNGADRPEVFVADTGYWSIHNATLDIDAEVLITPMPLTGGITDPDDPRLARPQASHRTPRPCRDHRHRSRRRDGGINHHRPQTAQEPSQWPSRLVPGPPRYG